MNFYFKKKKYQNKNVDKGKEYLLWLSRIDNNLILDKSLQDNLFIINNFIQSFYWWTKIFMFLAK